LGELGSTFRLAWLGVQASWGTETQRTELRRNLPGALMLALVAMVLLIRGRSWALHFSQLGEGRTQIKADTPAAGLLRSLISLAQIAVPLLGVYALVQALHAAGILGLRAHIMVDTLPFLGLCFFGARWLALRVFGGQGIAWPVFPLEPAQAARARQWVVLVGLFYGLWHALAEIGAYESYSDETLAVLSFPLILASGLSLAALGRSLRVFSKESLENEAETAPRFRLYLLSLTGRLLMLAGLAGPVAAAIGYAGLGEATVFFSALSAALLAVLLTLHHVFVDIYALLRGASRDESAEALVPVLASFALALAALPIFALIWGARVTDIREIWTRVGEGFALGDTIIQPSDFLVLAVVFALGYGVTRLIQGMLGTTILPKTKIDIGGRNAITSGVGYVGIFLAALLAITAAGFNLSSLAIVAGALSVGIGFGLQNVVSNFVSGIILLIERPISEGDWIEVGGQMGYVRDISVRSTRIETFDRTDVILPNSDLISGVVTNFTRGNLIGRAIIPVGVAYGTDTRRVEAILREIAEAHPIVALNPAPSIVFQGFGADSLDFEIRAILKDVNYVLSVKSDINHEIARRFTEEGIEIPFAQRDVWLRNPEVLSGGIQSSGEVGAVNQAALTRDDMGSHDGEEGDD
jgi:small-conductance mechanosensitive channel